MTRRRWIADEVSGNHAALTGAHADHLIRALRARAGQEFDIVAGGIVRRGRIANIAQSRVDFELAEEVQFHPSAVQLILLLAIFKFDRLEWAIEKCTELGVARIVPVIARRTDVHLASASAKRVDRWHRIALQAAEQSRRASAPRVDDPVKLKDAIGITAELRIVLSETEQESELHDIAVAHRAATVLLAVGPEGGWTEDELDLFTERDWISATLGPTILRAETAAIAAIAITMAALDT